MYYSLQADMLSPGHLSLLFPLSINISIFKRFSFLFLFVYVERWGRRRRGEISQREEKLSLNIICDRGLGERELGEVIKRYNKLAVVR